MINYRDIGHVWKLTEAQQKQLDLYYKGNIFFGKPN